MKIIETKNAFKVCDNFDIIEKLFELFFFNDSKIRNSPIFRQQY